MAQGLNNSWGIRTEGDPVRQVGKHALPQSLASRLHYKEGRAADEVRNMSDDDWRRVDPSGVTDQESVADVMRAYEHYALPSAPTAD